MIKCSNCGTEAYHGEQFCAQCGTPLNNESTADSDKTMLTFKSNIPDDFKTIAADSDKTILSSAKDTSNDKTMNVLPPRDGKGQPQPQPIPAHTAKNGWFSQRNIMIGLVSLLLCCCCCSTVTVGGVVLLQNVDTSQMK